MAKSAGKQKLSRESDFTHGQIHQYSIVVARDSSIDLLKDAVHWSTIASSDLVIRQSVFKETRRGLVCLSRYLLYSYHLLKLCRCGAHCPIRVYLKCLTLCYQNVMPPTVSEHS